MIDLINVTQNDVAAIERAVETIKDGAIFLSGRAKDRYSHAVRSILSKKSNIHVFWRTTEFDELTIRKIGNELENNPKSGPPIILPHMHFQRPDICFSNNPSAPYILVCPVRNAQNYVTKCLTSIIAQRSVDWHLIMIDDASDDETTNRIEEFVRTEKIENKITLVKNKIRMFGMWNVNFAIRYLITQSNPVIGLIDGDDWFYRKDAMSIVYKLFRKKHDLVWTQHVRHPSGATGYSLPATQSAPRNKRRGISAFRSFRKSLFDKIPESEFEGPDGLFLRYTYDKAITYPLSELAKNMKFLDQVMYVYNQENSQNVDKSNRDAQTGIAVYLEGKPRLA